MIKYLNEQEDTHPQQTERKKRKLEADAKKGKRKSEQHFKSGMALYTAAFLLAMSIFCMAQPACITASAPKKELPIYFVDRDDGKISISFDAAWGGDKTEKILDILDEYNVKTTFFLVDIWTERFPELVKEIVARGHEIGNHSTTHAEMSKQGHDAIVQELKVMSDHVEELTGIRPTLFRPPYGDYDDEVVRTARSEGYEVIQWSVDSLDWKNKGVQDLVSRSTKKVKSGDIILFHNDSQYIVEALPQILESYQSQGLQVVKVSEILLDAPWQIDHQGCQKPVPVTTATKIPEVES
ncbi:MAG: polysaccharide deacetylase family protein [Clostridia bacterium]|nr:polysaccharide deacetylase family protein [Clostridia bacterium]